jgi:D-threo-aldose 1-dehydrogenase
MTALPLRRLPRSGLQTSELGFGSASLGNLYRALPDADARATLEAALAAGINHIDTAPHYGHGLSERRVGDVLRGRDDVVLSTKVGRLLRPNAALTGDDEREGFRSLLPFDRVFDYTHDGVLRSYEDSLQRLGVARVDILYVHDIGRATHGGDHPRTLDQLTRGGGLRALERLRSEGAIRAFGLGVNEWEVCVDLMDDADVDVVLLAGRYTLLDQSALDGFLPLCLRRGISVVVGGPYNSGILATGTRIPGPLHYDYAKPSSKVVARVRRLETVCDRFGVRLPAAALQFPLAHPAVVSVIPGLDSARRVEETLSLYHTDIPAEFWETLRKDGLVPMDVPLPGGPRDAD